MFGYIIPDKPELKIKEYQLFKGYYCGLCKSISKHYGQIPRFTLSYDCVFMGLFLSSLLSGDIDICTAGCITKPFRKLAVLKDNPILEYAASANVIFAYYKVRDDFKDDKDLKAVPAIPLIYPAYLKAKKKATDLEAYTRFYLAELGTLEAGGCDSVDEASQPFAKLLAKTVSPKLFFSEYKTRETLEGLGYNVGKWLYTIDALDDIASDRKNKNYNPIIEQYYNGSDSIESFKERVKEDIGFVLRHSLKKIWEAYESLDIKCNRAILDNIIYGGIYKKTHEILDKEIVI